jgi:hypothetical protein
LKNIATWSWYFDGNGTDPFGFSALVVGKRDNYTTQGDFQNMGVEAYVGIPHLLKRSMPGTV